MDFFSIFIHISKEKIHTNISIKPIKSFIVHGMQKMVYPQIQLSTWWLYLKYFLKLISFLKNHANYNQCACVHVYVIEQSDNDVVWLRCYSVTSGWIHTRCCILIL